MSDAAKTPNDDTALDDLDKQADRTEDLAVDAGILPDEDAPKFHESGTIHPELDDQTIAPPG